MEKDVVCGMDVDENSAEFNTDYQGKTYYFCAKGCMEAFQANPGRYLPPSTGGGCGCGCGH